MIHITQTTRFGHWDQAIKKWEASKINLKKLQQCGSCYTRVKKPGLCDYCSLLDEKFKALLELARGVNYAQHLPMKIPTRPLYKCEICGLSPRGRGTENDNYLIFGDKTHCKICKKAGKI